MQSLWMLVASFLFSIMGVGVKLASAHFSVAEIVACRGIIGMLTLGLWIRWHGGTLRTSMAAHHLWRGAVGVAALWLWFYAISQLPLAMAVTLNYMSPIWIAAILLVLAWRRRERGFDPRLIAAILCGFAGVVLLLRPSIHADQLFGGVLALFSGMLAALAYLQVREMGLRGEPEYRVVFYFSLTCAIAGVVGSVLIPAPQASLLTHWRSIDLHGVGLLVLIGLTATSAQIAMTRAYRLGNTLLTANLQYAGIVFSSVWDVLLWHDSLAPLSWLGIAVIVLSGLAATFYNSRIAAASAAASPVS